MKSRELSKQVHENKHQLPDIEDLMDIVGQTKAKEKQGTSIFYIGRNVRVWLTTTQSGNERTNSFSLVREKLRVTYGL